MWGILADCELARACFVSCIAMTCFITVVTPGIHQAPPGRPEELNVLAQGQGLAGGRKQPGLAEQPQGSGEVTRALHVPGGLGIND